MGQAGEAGRQDEDETGSESKERMELTDETEVPPLVAPKDRQDWIKRELLSDC